MAYGSYYPQNYYPQGQAMYNGPLNAPQYSQNVQGQQGNGINWVQGEAGAKAYPVGAGQSVMLMDSEDSVFYIKSMDGSGMPQPLRVFDYTERNAARKETSISDKTLEADYVSRKEFEEFREDVKRSIKGIRKPKIEEEE